MHSITIGEYTLNYMIRHTRRKTIRLKLIRSDHLEITAPLKMPHQEIGLVLQTKAQWLHTQIMRLSAAEKNPLNKELAPGCQLLFLGKPRFLAVERSGSSRARVKLSEETITVLLPESDDPETLLRDVLKKWYIASARQLLEERTQHWAAEIGVRPQRVFIREQKTRWGSCSFKNNINYNWRIIMAPPSVVDYLVIHELCHIKIHNHSRDYWTLVGQSAPDFKVSRKWLRDHGRLLTLLFSSP